MKRRQRFGATYKRDKLKSRVDDDVIESEENESAVARNFNGPYQPNYGNQYNIDHLTLEMNPDQLMPGLTLRRESLASDLVSTFLAPPSTTISSHFKKRM